MNASRLYRAGISAPDPRPRPTTLHPMKRPSSISVALLLAGAALASCSSPSKAEELYGLTDENLGVYLENALYYVELNDWDRVIDQATRGLELDPENERFQLMSPSGPI